MYHARVRSASTLGTSYSAWVETGSAVQVNEALAFSAPAPTNRVYTVNMAIAPVILPEATGGTGTISYTLTGPNGTDLSEVPGLTFTATNRQLSGTPTTAGTTTLTYTATDSATPTPVMVEREFTITINPDATSPTLDTAAINGNTLTLTYDKALDGGSVPAGGDFTIGGVPSVRREHGGHQWHDGDPDPVCGGDFRGHGDGDLQGAHHEPVAGCGRECCCRLDG